MATPPIILYSEIVKDVSITVSSERAPYYKENLIDDRPYTYWQADTYSANVEIVFDGISTEIDSIGICGHNLLGKTIYFKYYDSGSGLWVSVVNYTVTSNNNIFKKLSSGLTKAKWKLEIANTGTTTYAYIGEIKIGKCIQFAFCPVTSFSPVVETMKHDSQISKQGLLLGSNVAFIEQRITAKFVWLSRTWVDTWIKPFWEYAQQKKPFFWIWAIDIYPDEVYYCTLQDGSSFQTPLSIREYVDEINFDMIGYKQL